jgi:hypothetical protein
MEYNQPDRYQRQVSSNSLTGFISVYFRLKTPPGINITGLKLPALILFKETCCK